MTWVEATLRVNWTESTRARRNRWFSFWGTFWCSWLDLKFPGDWVQIGRRFFRDSSLTPWWLPVQILGAIDGVLDRFLFDFWAGFSLFLELWSSVLRRSPGARPSENRWATGAGRHDGGSPRRSFCSWVWFWAPHGVLRLCVELVTGDRGSVCFSVRVCSSSCLLHVGLCSPRSRRWNYFCVYVISFNCSNHHTLCNQ